MNFYSSIYMVIAWLRRKQPTIYEYDEIGHNAMIGDSARRN